MTDTSLRRSEFDWLRVIAFGILIFYHTGMLFVTWDWHIKNNELSGAIEWPMLFVSQWRMPLIFLVSGAGVYHALGYRPLRVFVKDRLKRILLPLMAGILLLVAPQVYVERLTQGYDKNYFEFYLSFLSFTPYPAGDFSWHHLWFLLYILLYCLLFAPILVGLKKKQHDLDNIKSSMIFILPVLWLGAGESLLSPVFPKTGALYNDWFSHFIYISMFFAGFFIASSESLQNRLKASRKSALVAAVICSVILYAFFWIGKSGWEYIHPVLYHYLSASHRWCWMLAIVGFALTYFNSPSPRLTNMNQYIYPFYILHQTVIIILGYYLREMPWSIFMKFCIISLSTIMICYLFIRYVIMKVSFLRVAFGMKRIRK